MTEIGKLLGEDVFIRKDVIVGEDTTDVHSQDTVQLKVGLSTTVFALIHHVTNDGELIPFPAPNNPKIIKKGTRAQKILCPHLEIN